MTTLADVIKPEVFADYFLVPSPELTAFAGSGVIVNDPFLDAQAVEGGNIVNLPFWNDLDSDEDPNLSDTSGTNSTPNKVTAGKQTAMSADLNNSWGAKDLAGSLAGDDPMKVVAARVDVYWARVLQKRIIATLDGIKEDNEANNAGDMVHDISTESYETNGTEANLINADAIADAIFTLGDAFNNVGAIAIHSTPYARLVKLELIDTLPSADGTTLINFYLGKRIIVDDGLTTVAGATDGEKYTTYFFGAGAIGFGNGKAKVPVEVNRNPAGGNGGGEEVLYSRKSWLIHPAGYAFDASSVAKESASIAELRDGALWNRVVERKNVPLAFLVTNG